MERRRLHLTWHMTSPIIGPSELVHENPFQKIYRVPVDFGRHCKEYFVRDDGRHVGLLVVRGDEVLLVRQFRLLINGLSWEIPGGGIDEGETPEEAATRECMEETGVLCRNLKPLINYQLGLDNIKNPTYIYLSHDFVEGEQPCPDASEVVEKNWVRLSDCMDMIFSQEISGSFSIVALFAFQTWLNDSSLNRNSSSSARRFAGDSK